ARGPSPGLSPEYGGEGKPPAYTNDTASWLPGAGPNNVSSGERLTTYQSGPLVPPPVTASASVSRTDATNAAPVAEVANGAPWAVVPAPAPDADLPHGRQRDVAADQGAAERDGQLRVRLGDQDFVRPGRPAHPDDAGRVDRHGPVGHGLPDRQGDGGRAAG